MSDGRYKKFIFPEAQGDLKKVVDIAEARGKMTIAQTMFSKYAISNLFTFKEADKDNLNTIVAVCSLCQRNPAKLIWVRAAVSKMIKQSREYTLKLFNNHHSHSFAKNQVGKKILQFMQKQYGQIPLQELKLYIMRKFDAEEMEFQSVKFDLLKKIYEDNFLTDLENFSKKHILKTIPDKPWKRNKQQIRKPIQFAFVSSKKLMKRLNIYGRVIFLHRLPRAIEKTIKSQFAIIIVSGLNQYNNIIFFGFSIISTLNPAEAQSKYITLTLEHLFAQNGTANCETIFTERQPFLEEGVKNFTKNCLNKINLLLDANLDLSMDDKLAQKKEYYKRMIKAPTLKQFSTIYSQYQNANTNSSTVIINAQLFRKKANLYCLSSIPATFVGILPPLTHLNDILSKLTSHLPSNLPYNIFIFKMFHFINNQQIWRYPEVTVFESDIPYLSDCNNLIPFQPFQKIVNNWHSTFQINDVGPLIDNSIKIGDFIVKIEDKDKEKKKRTSVFYQNFQQIDFNQYILACSCEIRKKTGIPCCHVIKACMNLQIPVSSQIDQFWRVRKEFRERETKNQNRLQLNFSELSIYDKSFMEKSKLKF